MLGVQREVSLRLVPTAQVDDYVLVHAGFSIQVIDPAEAEETLRLVRDRRHPAGPGCQAGRRKKFPRRRNPRSTTAAPHEAISTSAPSRRRSLCRQLIDSITPRRAIGRSTLWKSAAPTR